MVNVGQVLLQTAKKLATAPYFMLWGLTASPEASANTYLRRDPKGVRANHALGRNTILASSSNAGRNSGHDLLEDPPPICDTRKG